MSASESPDQATVGVDAATGRLRQPAGDEGKQILSLDRRHGFTSRFDDNGRSDAPEGPGGRMAAYRVA